MYSRSIAWLSVFVHIHGTIATSTSTSTSFWTHICVDHQAVGVLCILGEYEPRRVTGWLQGGGAQRHRSGDQDLVGYRTILVLRRDGYE